MRPIDPADWQAPTFWDELAACHRERVPGVWRRPFGDAPIDLGRAFDWAVCGADNLRSGDKRSRFRIYTTMGVELPPTPERLPFAADGSIADYVRRVDDESPESGLVINNLQATCPDAWRVCRALLGEIRRHCGQTVGGASCEIFAGAYRRGPFGVHKDDQDVITLVLEGKKRFVLWPYARFADRGEVLPASELKPVALNRFDHREAMEGAIVLEGLPGDVFYWPAEWWHVAESDGVHCTTFGVGIMQGVTLARIAEDVAGEVVLEGGAPPVPMALPRPGEARAALIAALEAPDFAERIEDKVMAMASVMGCRAVPDPHADPLPRDPDTMVRGVPGAVLTRVVDGTLTWAVHGAVLHYPAAPPLVALLERVTSGEPTTIGALMGLADGSVATSAIEHVLDLLYQSYALDPGTPPQM